MRRTHGSFIHDVGDKERVEEKKNNKEKQETSPSKFTQIFYTIWQKYEKEKTIRNTVRDRESRFLMGFLYLIFKRLARERVRESQRERERRSS